MNDDNEIKNLLIEIRDIQKERLSIQKKSLMDQDEAKIGVRASLEMQRRAAKIQKNALIIVVIVTILLILLVVLRPFR